MRILLCCLAAILLFCDISHAGYNYKFGKKERYYQEIWCKAHNGRIEVVLQDRTRCDCLTANYAIEFDFARKWAESITQALHYSMQTGKRPGVVIICKKRRDLNKLAKIKNISDRYGLNLTIWSINCN